MELFLGRVRNKTPLHYLPWKPALSEAVKEAICLKDFLATVMAIESVNEPINIYCDNLDAVKVSKDEGSQIPQ